MSTIRNSSTVALCVASLLLSSSKAEAQQNVFSPFMDYCIALGVKRQANNDDIGSPRQLIESCSCAENRWKQGMRAEDCPRVSTISRLKIKEYFTGEW